MWLAILIVSLVLFVLHAIWFSGRALRALTAVFPHTRRWHRTARIVYLVIACSVPAVFVLYALYALIARPDRFGGPESRLYDLLIVYPFWLVTLISFQSTLLIAPLDLVHLAARRLGIAAGERWNRRRHALALALIAAFTVYVPVRIALDTSALEVRVHEYTSAELPADLDGFTIALVADLQADRYTGEDRLAELVDAVNQREPDLVLIAGDMITRAPRYIEPAARQAGRLRAPYGVLACVGDHDNFAYMDRRRSLREVTEALARYGVEMLDNQVRRIRVGDAEVAVVLATNNYVSRIDRETAASLMAAARGADFLIVTAHQTGAELLAEARAAGADLFLGGHTHGGQVRFWLPLFDLTPVRFETPYIDGAYRLGDMMLTVTSGLGMSVTPMRYRAPPTVDIIRLRRTAR